VAATEVAPDRVELEAARAAPRRISGAALAWPLAIAVISLGAWEFVSRSGIVDPIILPPPSEVAAALVRLCQRGFFWDAVQVTVLETVLGFVIGCFAGFVLGAAIGTVKQVRWAIYPYIIAFQNTPRVAFAPVFLTWFGFGMGSKVVMAAAICFFPLLINVVVGIETVDEHARQLMRSYGASKRQTFLKVTLPSSLPLVFAGLKTAKTLAQIGAIVAEFVGATEGLGVLINTFNFQLEVAEAFAVVVMLSIIGLVLYGAIELLDRRVVFWRDH
jgi:NitT/TauT family transport system permease protein